MRLKIYLLTLFLLSGVTNTWAAYIQFCSPSQAREVIIRDNIDGFFDVITALDLSIQLAEKDTSSTREALLENYKIALQNDVLSFSQEEVNRVKSLTEYVKDQMDALNPDLFPDTINYIKVKGKLYGSMAFFTRQKAIILPEGALSNLKDLQLRSVIAHEVAHIISRYHVKLRNELYSHIGFEEIRNEVQLNKPLSGRLLSNPDGISRRHIIRLKDESSGKEIHAIPLLYSKYDRYTEKSGGFFSHLQFELYEVEPDGNGEWQLVQVPGLYSTVTEEYYLAYNVATGNFTSYIIHPDEIIAEYLAAIFAKDDKTRVSMIDHAVGSKMVQSLADCQLNW